MTTDFLIVGQGIAGTWLSYFLYKAGRSFLIIDDQDPHAASMVASGIINPITGRNFVKTWLADELMPFSDAFYPELEALVNQELYKKEKIFKVLNSFKDQNVWSTKAGSDYFNPYLASDEITQLDRTKIHNPYGAFEIDARRVHGKRLIYSYRKWLQDRQLIRNENFEHRALSVALHQVEYKGIQAGQVIFCDGFHSVNHPLFSWLPFVLTKGEALLVRIAQLDIDYIINGNILLMPFGEKHHYYAGSTKEWKEQSRDPSVKMEKRLLEGIRRLTSLPFEVCDHLAGIRPTTRDRRPFIGRHPEHEHVLIFNGFGTKGFSLSPYFASQLVDHILSGKELHPEANITRNLALYEA